MKSYFQFACAAALACSSASLPAAESAELRGYGRVTADVRPDRAAFTCQSDEKADVLLGKMLADLFWNRSADHTRVDITVRGKTYSAHALSGQGTALIARVGSQVVAIGAPDAAKLTAAAEADPLLAGGQAVTEPAQAYPIYLDYYDLRALKFYVHPMASAKKEGLESHWPFANKFGASQTFQYVCPPFSNPAPGVVAWASADYEVKMAERAGGMVVIGPSGGGEVAFWTANRYPNDMMRPSETALLGEWGGTGMAAAKYESWGMPREVRMKSALGFLRASMERYVHSPALGGWHMYGGSPGVEFGFHDGVTMSWDQSPAGEELWRHYLRDVAGYSLADVGTRWHNDPKRYASWEQVTVPNNQGFFGPLNAECLHIHNGWRYLDVIDKELTPPAASAKWTAINLPPSQEQAFLGGADRFFNVTVDASAWPGAESKNIWLVMGATGVGDGAISMWLNGKPLTMPTDHESKMGPFAVSVSGALTKGRNDLLIRMRNTRFTSKARIAGPVFLTASEPKRPPYLDRGTNTLFADFRTWQAWAMTQTHRDLLDVARAIDPDRPFVLSGAARNTFDQSADLAAEYGMSCQHTGREAWYHPWWAGLGITNGFYGTDEPSATARGNKLDRLFGWMMIDGDSSSTLFWDIEDYIQEEKNNGWFTRHADQLKLVGKYLRVKPKLVLFRSAQTMRLGIETGWNWDLGRGELQAAQMDNAYATEHELSRGLLGDFPVMIDTGSEIMDAPVVNDLKKWIENGGTFVALHNTGIHSSYQANENPLSALSGFRMLQQTGRGKLTFEKNLPILRAFAGKTFEGTGTALDYTQADSAKNGVKLEPAADNVRALARWEDGSIAVGYRKIGKGHMIALGSTFWRHGKDSQGAWLQSSDIERHFLDELLRDCGVERIVAANSKNIWCRPIIMKNGLYTGMITFNSTEEAQSATVRFRHDRRPEQVVNLITGKPAQFRYENGWVTIPEHRFEPYAVEMYGIESAGITTGLQAWWNEKATYWKRSGNAKGMPDWAAKVAGNVSGDAIIPIEQWRFTTDPDRAISGNGQWLRPGYSDGQWLTTAPGFWHITQAAPKDYAGTGLYRFAFTAKKDRPAQALLNLYSFNEPVVADSGTVYINGRKLDTIPSRYGSQTYQYDISTYVQDGENIVGIEVTAGKQNSGLLGATWIEYRKPLEQARSTAKQWNMVGAPGTDGMVPAKLPGAPIARNLVADIAIPSEWKGRRVCMDLVLRSQCISIISINGSPVGNNSYAHSFGPRPRINLTPYLRFGETNRIELWSQGTVSAQSDFANKKTIDYRVDDIIIGCETIPE